jgi:ketosteroid isomerase-like protein
MKVLGLALVIAFVFLSVPSFSQQSDEDLIRELEDQEREAILKGDTLQLARLMSEKIVVQNPENTIVGFRQIIDRIKRGKINYSIFQRRIDNIAFINGIAVVMGSETLVPKGVTENADKTVQRRFTNVWTKENNRWKLTARQATVVSIN